MRLIVVETARDGATYVADKMTEQMANKPDSLLGLATGGTVVELYGELAARCDAGAVDFSKARTVNLDEYVGLSAANDQSFAFFMNSNLFSRTNFNRDSIYLIDGAGDPETERGRINAFLERNIIDFQLLGIGSNGHIGFNEPDDNFESEPHQVTLAEETIEANARFFQSREDVPRSAVTIGMRDIVRAEKVVLMAYGAGKADAVKRLFADSLVYPQLPCSVLKLCRDATVVVDRELADAAKIGS